MTDRAHDCGVEVFGRLVAEGSLSAIASQYADFVCRHAPEVTDADNRNRLWLAAALASQSVEDSHVCIQLSRLYEADESGVFPAMVATSGDDEAATVTRVTLPPLSDWLDFLRGARCAEIVGTPELAASQATPLVLDVKGRLYLHRYYLMEQRLAAALKAMNVESPVHAVSNDDGRVRDCLARLFPHVAEPKWETNWPKIAAYSALRHRLTIITGGPGTGKTSVVGKLLTLMQTLCVDAISNERLKVRLAAPTGKAAARLSQGLNECLADLRARGVDVPAETLQVTASTLHRLLGYRRGSIHFRHNANHPIDADLIIIDEASMVTLPQMLRLVQAVPDGARLILLGDMKQLASVESGFVLGDLCEAMPPQVFSEAFRTAFAAVADSAASDKLPTEDGEGGTGLADACVELTYSWRFRPDSHVDRVSRAVNEGDGARALAELAEPAIGLPTNLANWQEPGILGPLSAEEAQAWEQPPRTHVWHRRNVPSWLLRGNLPDAAFSSHDHFHDRYRHVLEARDPEAALLAFDQFRILCATRGGSHGVAALNLLVEAVLGLDYAADRAAERDRLHDCCLPAKSDRWGHYDHRPILVTENNYSLDLYNGDTGIILKNPDYQTDSNLPRFLAWFPAVADAADQTALRAFVPEMLPAHETAWAMTIHKSQGSQFDDVLVVLPHRDNPVVGRELIYTAVTRAKRRAELWLPSDPNDHLFQSWVNRSTDRHSGLVDALD